jgi:phage N-6-adenine-methyltransferase
MSEPAQKPYRSKQTYGTPDEFLYAVKRYLGIAEFAHDFAADEQNSKALGFWGEDADSLSQPRWDGMLSYGDWGWLNPPFTRIGPWAQKCVETKRRGGQMAFLVPAAVGSNWFRDYVDGHARVLFLNGRLTFAGETTCYPKDCILALYSHAMQPDYEVWKWRSE